MTIFTKLSYGASIAALMALAPVAAVEAQQTSASVRGSITDGSGAALDGASVTLIHTPTASVSTATTNQGGTFSQSNLRVGGPYRITVERAGFEPEILEDIYLQPGSQNPLRITLRTETQTDTIMVRGQRLDSLSIDNGVGSVFSARELASQPSLNRDFTDVLARDPLVSSNGGGELNIGGLSSKLNSLTVDGIAVQEEFGINSSGVFPSQRPPIDIDAIEAVSVSVADFSVLNSGFQGGLVNVVTKSGTNEFDGVLGFYTTDDSMVGENAFGREIDSGDFSEEEVSINIGGPIIRDRLFFFVNYSEFQRETPLNFNFGDTDPEIFNIVRDLSQDVFGYDPGEKGSVNAANQTDRLLTKFDWVITDNHRATFTYLNLEETQVGSFGTFDLPSAARTEDLSTNQYSGELFSDWTDNFSTIVRVGLKKTDFTRTPIGQAGGAAGSNFSAIQIRDIAADDPYFAANGLDGAALVGSSPISINLGPDRFDQANAINDELFTLYAQGDYVLGDHTISVGGQWEDYSVQNVFVPGSAGVATVEGLQTFADGFVNEYFVDLPESGDVADAITSLEYKLLSLFVQDSWTVTPSLELTGGVRYERFIQDGQAPERLPVTINGVTTSFQDAYGISGRDTLDGADIFLPRFGFNYSVNDDLTIRGGFGLYAGGNPQVLLANQFVPNTFRGSLDDIANFNGSQIPQSALDQIADAAANANGDAVPAFGVFDPDFEIPSQLRFALAADYSLDLTRYGLGDDYRITLQALRSEANNAALQQNLLWSGLRDDIPQTGVAPDGRPIYANIDALGIAGAPILLTNTDEGFATQFSARVAKSYDFGVTFDVAYTWQEVEAVNDLGSSRAVSNFRGQSGPDRQNGSAIPVASASEHAFNVFLRYENDFVRDLTSSFTLFGRIDSGRPISYGMRSFNHLFGNPADGEFAYGNNDPLYVPTINAAGDGFDDPNATFADADVEADLLEFIEARGLEGYQGDFVQPGEDRSAWTQRWDFGFEQELPGIPGAARYVGDNNLKLTVDIQNVLNLISDDWGQRLNGPSNAGVTAARVNLVDTATGNTLRGNAGEPVCGVDTSCVYDYQFLETDASGEDIISENFSASVWRARIGIRYEF
ncbi:TonB-dependent receptor [Maricaulaceae bacterium MS644]